MTDIRIPAATTFGAPVILGPADSQYYRRIDLFDVRRSTVTYFHPVVTPPAT